MSRRFEWYRLPFASLRARAFFLSAWAVFLLVSPVQSRAQEVISLGYLYPAGLRRGSSALVTVGGQNLRGAKAIHITGTGVRARVLLHSRPLNNLNKEQNLYLRARLQSIWDKRLGEILGAEEAKKVRQKLFLKEAQETMAMEVCPEDNPPSMEEMKIPNHPLFYKLEEKSLRELTHLTHMLFLSRRYRQPNRQIAELLLLEIAADADAPAEDRELRIETQRGVTNPMTFQVGTLPEVIELEPNNQSAAPDLPTLPAGLIKDAPLSLPVLVNGQIMPGDADRFRFEARKGQELVLAAHARQLVPYLADAVPGWFQATLTLYDPAGKEVAFADDYRFDPDPVLFYTVPEDGAYEVKIHDAIYRGREDFVYRIAIGELPFISRIFPLGGEWNKVSQSQAEGVHLPTTTLPLQTALPGLHRGSLPGSNAMPYFISEIPGRKESEPNAEGEAIVLPLMLDGQILASDDVDRYCFDGREGETIVAEVFARRLQSPLDSLLRLLDSGGKVLAWNDDHVEKEKHLHKDITGLVTHHADAYLSHRLPANGRYTLELSDTTHQGSKAHAYRLRVSHPMPEVALRITPSSLYFNQLGIVPVEVHALRKDGFDGPVSVAVTGHAGFKLSGGTIPAGVNRIAMTLQAPDKTPGGPVALALSGTFQRNGKVLSRPVVPADDVMQAFLWRHLVPAKELTAVVKPIKWKRPQLGYSGATPLRLVRGETTSFAVKAPGGKQARAMVLELHNPPEGFELLRYEWTRQGLVIALKVTEKAPPAGHAGNLILRLLREWQPRARTGKARPAKKRAMIGVLPAIPYVLAEAP